MRLEYEVDGLLGQQTSVAGVTGIHLDHNHASRIVNSDSGNSRVHI